MTLDLDWYDDARCAPPRMPTLRCNTCQKFNAVELLCDCPQSDWRPTTPTEWNELFHPLKGKNFRHWPEKFCATCPVKAECLAEALANPNAVKWGIWGGTSEMQRRSIRRGLSLTVVCAVCGRDAPRRSMSQTVCERAACRAGIAPIQRKTDTCPQGHKKHQAKNGRWYCAVCTAEHNKDLATKRKTKRARIVALIKEREKCAS